MKALRRKADKAWISVSSGNERAVPDVLVDDITIDEIRKYVIDPNAKHLNPFDYELVDVEVTVKELEPPTTHAIKDIVIEARYDNGQWIGEVCVKYDDCREMHKLASMDEFRSEILTKELIPSIVRELTEILNQEPVNAGIKQI